MCNTKLSRTQNLKLHVCGNGANFKGRHYEQQIFGLPQWTTTNKRVISSEAE
jgi:hypothetical protein